MGRKQQEGGAQLAGGRVECASLCVAVGGSCRAACAACAAAASALMRCLTVLVVTAGAAVAAVAMAKAAKAGTVLVAM